MSHATTLLRAEAHLLAALNAYDSIRPDAALRTSEESTDDEWMCSAVAADGVFADLTTAYLALRGYIDAYQRCHKTRTLAGFGYDVEAAEEGTAR